MVRAFFVLKMKEMFRISEQEKEIVMRRSNWKSKLVVVIAVVIGILCGLAAAYVVNQKVGAAYLGLAFFNVFDDPCVSHWRVGGKNDETKQDAE